MKKLTTRELVREWLIMIVMLILIILPCIFYSGITWERVLSIFNSIVG